VRKTEKIRTPTNISWHLLASKRGLGGSSGAASSSEVELKRGGGGEGGGGGGGEEEEEEEEEEEAQGTNFCAIQTTGFKSEVRHGRAAS